MTTAPLADIARINPRRPPDFVHPPDDAPTAFIPMAAVQVDSGGANPIFRPYAQVRQGYTFFQSGDVLFAKITPCMQNGKHFIAPKTPDGFGFASTEFHVIRPQPGVLAEWIHLYLRQPSVLSEAVRHFSGTAGQQRVPPKFLMKLQIPFPPLPEQKRIVKSLSANLRRAAKMKAAMRAQAEAISAMPHSILAQIFMRGNKTQKGWRVISLGDIVSAQVGFASGARDNNGVVQVRMHNLSSEFTFVWDKIVRVPVDGELPEKHQLAKGDIIFNNTNSTALVGKSALFSAFPEPVSFSNHMTRLRVNRTVCAPEYLVAWIRWQWQQGVFAHLCTRWIGQSAIRSNKLLDLEIPVPPLSEQRIIAGTLKAKMKIVAKLQSAAQAQLDAVEALPAAFLRRAFSGR